MTTDEIRSRSQLELGPDDAGRVLSAEEFADAVYKEPWRYERVRGELVVIAPDGGDHVETASPWLEGLFGYRINHRETVQHVVPYVWLHVDAETDRSADIGVYLAGNPGGKKIPDRVPELTFEFVRRRRESRDTYVVEKCSDYKRLGVKEYVIVDRFKKQVTVYILAHGEYHAQVLTAADTYTSPLLPGLAIPLAEVWKP